MFRPGLSSSGKGVLPADHAFLERSWSTIAAACAEAKVAAVVGTERVVDGTLLATALVVAANGTIEGFQDKVQIDPTEEGTYSPGVGRRVFHSGALTFGVVICHEGWRYPETVRWAARRGAHVVFRSSLPRGRTWRLRPIDISADPANTFHEKAVLCRAAENTCYVASINVASVGSPTTSAVARPNGTLLAYQPYGKHGLLIADLDLATATGLLASRCKAGS